jgi:hypothetical protein
MIMKEQIEDTLALIATQNGDGNFVKLSSRFTKELCRLALERLDMEPRPMSEIKENEGMIFYMNPSKKGGYATGLAYKSTGGKYVNEIESTWHQIKATHFIPLSALPTPRGEV